MTVSSTPTSSATQNHSYHIDDSDDYDGLDDDEVIQEIRRKRLEAMSRHQPSSTLNNAQDIFGELCEISTERELLALSLSARHLVIHFSRQDFRRCRILSDKLKVLARAHPTTKFVVIEAEKAPFLVGKFLIQVLPCIVCIVNAILKDRIVGFDELGGTDDFPIVALEHRLAKSGVIVCKSAPGRSTSASVPFTNRDSLDTESD